MMGLPVIDFCFLLVSCALSVSQGEIKIGTNINRPMIYKSGVKKELGSNMNSAIKTKIPVIPIM